MNTGLDRAGEENYRGINKKIDLSQNLKRPAELRVDINENRLYLYVLIPVESIYFLFTYFERSEQKLVLAEAEKYWAGQNEALVDRLTTFLPTYQWTGQNQKPGKNQLTARYGYLNIDEALPDLRFSIEYKTDSGEDSFSDFFSYNVFLMKIYADFIKK